MSTHKQSTVLVAIAVAESLESGAEATPSAIETMPKLITKLRDFDESALADRLQIALDAYVTRVI